MTLQTSLTLEDIAREGLTDAGVGRNIGTLDTPADEDYFLFLPRPFRDYVIRVDSAADTEAGLYTVPGLALALEDDDTGPGFNPELRFRTAERPTAVVLQVDAAGAAEPGTDGQSPGLADYTLDIFELVPADGPTGTSIFNDTVGGDTSTAGAIGTRAPVVRAIQTPGDVDVYAAFLEAGVQYEVTLDAVAVDGLGTLDPFLDLFAPDGTPVDRNDNRDANSTGATLSFAVAQSGFFFLAASASDIETGTGGYSLAIRDRGPVPSEGDLVPGSFDEAVPAEVETQIIGDVETPRDIDAFRFAFAAGNTYRIDALGLEDFDPALALVDDERNQLAFNDDREPGDLDPLITFTAPETAFYTVAIGGASPEFTGRYDLLVEIADSVALTTIEAQFVALLYRAGFGREADIGGLNFWIDGAEAGLSFLDLAGEFIESPEFLERVGDPDTLTDPELVDALYVDNLGRGADPEGRAFWIGALADPAFGPENLLFAFADAPENRDLFPEIQSIENTPEGWDFTA